MTRNYAGQTYFLMENASCNLNEYSSTNFTIRVLISISAFAVIVTALIIIMNYIACERTILNCSPKKQLLCLTISTYRWNSEVDNPFLLACLLLTLGCNC